MEDRFPWHSLKRDVALIIKLCCVCQLAREKEQNLVLYTPLPVPHAPWEDFSMDFVLSLPKNIQGNASLCVVVDQFSKMSHFIPCAKTFDASRVASLFLKYVVRLHELQKTIIFNWGVKFVTYSWKTLWAKLVTKLKYSSAFHLQTNSQIEVVYGSLGNLLR